MPAAQRREARMRRPSLIFRNVSIQTRWASEVGVMPGDGDGGGIRLRRSMPVTRTDS